MFKRSVVLIAAALIAGLLLLGCGDDDGGDQTSAGTTGNNASTPAESPDKPDNEPSSGAGEKKPSSNFGGGGTSTGGSAAFVKQANAICKSTGGKFFGELRAVLAGDSGASELDAGGAEAFAEEAASPALEAEVEQLRGLEVPPADEKRFSAVLASIEKTAEEAKNNFKRFYSSSKALANAEKLADAAGLVSCPFS